MQIQPNSIIILYSGMPLDSDYKDTLYFASLSAQTSFFQSTTYILRTFTRNSYQRVNSGRFEAQCVADDIYNANYMAFQNTAYGNKWFYAFVDEINYLNNGNTEVKYTIDVMQTYFFDVELERCLVEREHSNTDTLYANITPEPNIVPTSDYYFEGYDILDPGTADNKSAYYPDIVLMYVDVNGSTVDGGVYNKTYSGSKVIAYDSDPEGQANLQAQIASYIQKPEAIVNIYMCPHFISRGTTSGRTLTPSEFFNQNEYEFDPTAFISDYFTKVGGYTPKNKKLFSYPYCFLHLDDGGTASMDLRLEYMDPLHLKWYFRIIGSNFSPVQLTIMPNRYKGVNKTYGMPLESLTIQSYPLCSWNYDTYKAWLAQNSVPMLIENAAGAVGNILNGNIGGLVQQGANVGVQIYKASIAADTIRGNINCGNALYGNDQLKFHIARAHLPQQYLKIVDDFFTMYGYAVNQVKIPNRDSRPHWTYTKTNGCKLKGSCPADAMAILRNVYDNGVTFWKNASEVGNYSLANSPTA